MKPDLTLDEVKSQIAALVSEYMGVDQALILSGKKFDTLIENFDSLAMVEVQLLVEKHYGFDLDFEDTSMDAFPADIDELAEAFLLQYQKHRQKIELKKAKSQAAELQKTEAQETELQNTEAQEAELQKPGLAQ
ncbi:hypothetical protein SAMN04515617_102279 [Collimonas sp. OK242]|jgi:acyl carrier protein|uniref:hypothetical protein n=1 Tax=Collimonas sp. OK242 TaxID=1798195 RepID=UPI00089B6FE1|nr:hypothetical protein [Collimonas sp. OK242]SDX27922.1 hypothetical protein SAMN04515617_102279 [Collimonas sp. OK242]